MLQIAQDYFECQRIQAVVLKPSAEADMWAHTTAYYPERNTTDEADVICDRLDKADVFASKSEGKMIAKTHLAPLKGQIPILAISEKTLPRVYQHIEETNMNQTSIRWAKTL